ncbi:CST complex subunit [Trichinella spiralis]|uniref:CST complex subunit n=1 Tax=Trichinella spiralis TaxID=6334 RepID=A0ABR3KLG8_TRISP
MLVWILLSNFLSIEAFQRLSKKQLIMVDHVLTCRAHCVDAFAVKMNPHSDISCQSKVDCKMCWENCGMFYQKSEILNSICKDLRICFSGCQMACSIYRYDFPVHKIDQMGWSFLEPLKIIRSPEMGKLELCWDEPVPLFPISTLLPSGAIFASIVVIIVGAVLILRLQMKIKMVMGMLLLRNRHQFKLQI